VGLDFGVVDRVVVVYIDLADLEKNKMAVAENYLLTKTEFTLRKRFLCLNLRLGLKRKNIL